MDLSGLQASQHASHSWHIVASCSIPYYSDAFVEACCLHPVLAVPYQGGSCGPCLVHNRSWSTDEMMKRQVFGCSVPHTDSFP